MRAAGVLQGRLDTAGLHAYLLGRGATTAGEVREAAARYAALVLAGKDARLWDQALRQQIYLGDSEFVERMQALAARHTAKEVPRTQRMPPRRGNQGYPSLAAAGVPRDAAIYLAYVEGRSTMTELALQAGLSVSRVSRIIARQEVEAGPKS
jgi:putative transposase